MSPEELLFPPELAELCRHYSDMGYEWATNPDLIQEVSCVDTGPNTLAEYAVRYRIPGDHDTDHYLDADEGAAFVAMQAMGYASRVRGMRTGHA